jgi:hypothetical protein
MSGWSDDGLRDSVLRQGACGTEVLPSQMRTREDDEEEEVRPPISNLSARRLFVIGQALGLRLLHNQRVLTGNKMNADLRASLQAILQKISFSSITNGSRRTESSQMEPQDS